MTISRKVLVTQDGASITTGGSADFGVHHVAAYTWLSGLASTVGSLTLRMRSGVNSGSFQVSSNWAINSGQSIVSVPNYGRYAAFDITQARSSVYSLILFGEPTR